MERVLVIGPGGAGKSTFARKLAARRLLPLTSLDELYWQPGWVPTPHAEWSRIVLGLIEQDEWVLDGNYSRTLAPRLAAADTVFFFDFPRRRYILGALRRVWQNRGQPIQAADCPERLDLELLVLLFRWRSKRRPAVLQMLQEGHAEVIVFGTTREADHYLRSQVG